MSPTHSCSKNSTSVDCGASKGGKIAVADGTTRIIMATAALRGSENKPMSAVVVD